MANIWPEPLTLVLEHHSDFALFTFNSLHPLTFFSENLHVHERKLKHDVPMVPREMKKKKQNSAL